MLAFLDLLKMKAQQACSQMRRKGVRRKEVQHHLLWYVDWECCEEDKYTSLDIFATLFIVLSVESSNN